MTVEGALWVDRSGRDRGIPAAATAGTNYDAFSSVRPPQVSGYVCLVIQVNVALDMIRRLYLEILRRRQPLRLVATRRQGPEDMYFFPESYRMPMQSTLPDVSDLHLGLPVPSDETGEAADVPAYIHVPLRLDEIDPGLLKGTLAADGSSTTDVSETSTVEEDPITEVRCLSIAASLLVASSIARSPGWKANVSAFDLLWHSIFGLSDIDPFTRGGASNFAATQATPTPGMGTQA
ncbi:unnamed protein product [Symbiodinium sp. CCMP2592]|nr:unnamed protein product [Symbiodinium sp. CCMP2592]